MFFLSNATVVLHPKQKSGCVEATEAAVEKKGDDGEMKAAKELEEKVGSLLN